MVSVWAIALRGAAALRPAAHALEQAARQEARSALADPTNRARIALGILAILIAAGGGLLVIVLIGRYVRRIARKPLRPAHPEDDHWYGKPLAPGEDASDEGPDQAEP